MSCVTVIYYLGISDAHVEEEDLGKLDIESVGSDVDYPAHREVSEDSTGANNVVSGNSAEHEGEEEGVLDVRKEKNSDGNCSEKDTAMGIQFSLTTDVGLMEGVEIYDYDKRGTLEAFCCCCCCQRSRDGAVVRALASHQCGPGSIPGLGVVCGLSLLLVLVLSPRGFSPSTPVFPSPQKPIFSNSNSICQS